MRQTVSWLAALAAPAMLLVGPLVGADKKDADKDSEKGAEKPTEKLIKVAVVSGKVMAVYEDKRRLRIQVNIPQTKINQGAVSGLQQAQMQLLQAQARRDYQGMIQAQRQMAQHQNNLYTIENVTKEVEVQCTDDVVVRTIRPKEAFDDKGVVKKFTKAELKELKGPDPKLPGYKAEFGDLTADQILQCTIVRKKSATPPKVVKPRPKGKKAKDAEDAEDALADDLPMASQVLILADPPPSK